MLARPRGFEPLAFGFVAAVETSTTQCRSVQVAATLGNGSAEEGQERQVRANKWKVHVTPLLHMSVTVGEVPPPREPLLSVPDVALRLGVCTATVYELCARGRLPHVRVLNAIRVAPGDLEIFIESWRQSQF